MIEVAQESRFTVEEVKEYYDKCGDMDRTRNRFRRMRAVLAQLPDDEETVAPAVAPSMIGSPLPPTTAAAVNAIVEAANCQVPGAPQLSAPVQPGSVVPAGPQ